MVPSTSLEGFGPVWVDSREGVVLGRLIAANSKCACVCVNRGGLNFLDLIDQADCHPSRRAALVARIGRLVGLGQEFRYKAQVAEEELKQLDAAAEPLRTAV